MPWSTVSIERRREFQKDECMQRKRYTLKIEARLGRLHET
jgi:hypothetical protein